MPRRHRKERRHRKRLPALVLVTALASAVSPFYLVLPAQATSLPPSNFFTVRDTGGVNDEVGQGDLTQMGRDDTDPGTFKLFWSWDDASWPGANTGDACAMFDTNGNGDIDFAVCAEVGAGSGSTVVQSAGSPSSWTCDDSKNDRCAGPTAAASGATVGTLSTFDTSANADLVTDTDPFAGGSDAPNDSSVQVRIPKASLPAGAVLANVCSFPSIGNGGNDDPKDCVVNPGGGYLVIHKFSDNDNSTVFPFTLNPGGTAIPVTGNSDSATQFLAAGSGYSFSEAVPSGWVFTNAFCFTQGQRFTGTPSGTGVTNFTIEAGRTTTCDVTDVKESPDLGLTKSASPTTYSAAGQTITYTLTATNTGNNKLFSVEIDDPMLGGQLTDCTDGAGNAVNPPVDLNPGEKLICTADYTTTANDVSAGKVVNTATARGSGGEDERQFFRTATATVTLFVPPPPPPQPTGSPTLVVSKTSVPITGSTVHRGDQVTYTLTYGNTGTASASGVVLTDALPVDLDYVTGSAISGGTYDAATRTLTWQLGGLAAGANGAVTYTAQVAQTAADREVLHNVGVIAASGTAPIPSNGDDVIVAVPASAPVPVPTGAVTIKKSVDKHVARFGDTLTYSVTVGATGDKDQTHVVASDTVPDGTSYVAGSAACDSPCVADESDGIVTWNIGTLAPGTSTVVTFQVTIDKPLSAANGSIPAETISNIAQVSFDADPVETSNEVQTDIAAVLGEKAVRPPKTKPSPEPSSLPFTGLPVSLLQLLTMATIAIAVGSLLVRRGRVRPVVVATPLPVWRDQ
jgi:uncharacterized repeat protein (TIGR01451 family)